MIFFFKISYFYIFHLIQFRKLISVIYNDVQTTGIITPQPDGKQKNQECMHAHSHSHTQNVSFMTSNQINLKYMTTLTSYQLHFDIGGPQLVTTTTI